MINLKKRKLKIAKVYMVGVTFEMQKMLSQLPLHIVSDITDADILFVGSESLDDDLMDIMVPNVVPVLPESFGFIDYDPVREVGDAFNYDHDKIVSAIYALSRALENHKFVYDWKSIQSNFNTRLKLSKSILV